MKWVLISLGILLVIPAVSSVTATKSPVTVFENSAQAWIWAPADRQDEFVQVLQDFPRKRGLVCNPSNPPSPKWKMAGIVIVTPMQSDISVINSTDPVKFSASIILEHSEPDWRIHWDDLRAAANPKFKWQDIP